MEKLAFKTLYGILIANMLFQKDSGDVMLNQERVCLYYMEEILEQINSIDIRQAVIRGILIYVACMAVYLSITYAVYHQRYTKGRQKVKQYYLHLKRVNRIYHEEDQV